MNLFIIIVLLLIFFQEIGDYRTLKLSAVREEVPNFAANIDPFSVLYKNCFGRV